MKAKRMFFSTIVSIEYVFAAGGKFRRHDVTLFGCRWKVGITSKTFNAWSHAIIKCEKKLYLFGLHRQKEAVAIAPDVLLESSLLNLMHCYYTQT